MRLTEEFAVDSEPQRPVSIQELIVQLRQLSFSAFSDVPRILDFIRLRRVIPETLAPYLSWEQKHYTRNLVDKTPLYELIAICWNRGQGSVVHDHQNQNCWMAVPVGRLLVQNYRVIGQDLQKGTCKLVEAENFEMNSSRPVAVNPYRPVHRVYNPAEFDEKAVSLHLYSQPFDTCVVYSPESETCRLVSLQFTTQYGKREPAGHLCDSNLRQRSSE
jgi:cysteine dioxygenase